MPTPFEPYRPSRVEQSFAYTVFLFFVLGIAGLFLYCAANIVYYNPWIVAYGAGFCAVWAFIHWRMGPQK